jgi:Uma2 family endonuclease
MARSPYDQLEGEMALAAPSYTYADLQSAPDDHLRREIIDGQLFVTPSPATRHQLAVGAIHVVLHAYAQEHGGVALVGPTDVYFAESTVVVPDVLFVTAAHAERVEAAFVRGAPDLVVEVASPSTRRRDVGVKLALYEQQGVAEYWFVDLDADELHVWRAGEAGYGEPEHLAAVPRSPHRCCRAWCCRSTTCCHPSDLRWRPAVVHRGGVPGC